MFKSISFVLGLLLIVAAGSAESIPLILVLGLAGAGLLVIGGH